MKKAILAIVCTLLVSLLVMGIFYETLEFGILAAILVMGGFVIYFNDKKKSFYVSQFSYNGYRVNERGTLKYKGDKLIEFK